MVSHSTKSSQPHQKEEADDASDMDDPQLVADALQVIGAGQFSLDGDVHKFITFLNQTLKDKGFIFGVSKHPQEGLTIKIYQTPTSGE